MLEAKSPMLSFTIGTSVAIKIKVDTYPCIAKLLNKVAMCSASSGGALVMRGILRRSKVLQIESTAGWNFVGHFSRLIEFRPIILFIWKYDQGFQIIFNFNEVWSRIFKLSIFGKGSIHYTFGIIIVFQGLTYHRLSVR